MLSSLHEFETSLEQLDYVLGKINALYTKRFIQGRNRQAGANVLGGAGDASSGGKNSPLKSAKSLPESESRPPNTPHNPNSNLIGWGVEN